MIDPADNRTKPLPVTRPMRLRFESDDRHYSVILDQDLLGDWVVTQRWGGKFTRKGGGKTIQVTDLEFGHCMLLEIRKKRLKRGYRLVA
jgi:hypothetical protein